MARNATVALTAEQAGTVATFLPMLESAIAYDAASGGLAGPLTIAYVKRDGSDATLTGKVTEVVGTDSTMAVKVETDKGFRSANVWAIKSVSN